MGFLGERFQHRDVAIGIVLATSLGCGLLFLHFFTAYASQATALLFGNVLGVEAPTVLALLALGIITIGALASISRPLLFATLQPELAEAKGVSLRRLSVLFLVIVALATAASVQIVGILLVFTLMVAPAAAAQRVTIRLWPGLLLSVALALLEAWLGLTLAFYTDWPTSFWITALGAAIYVLALFRRKGTPAHRHEHEHEHGHERHGEERGLRGALTGSAEPKRLSPLVKEIPAEARPLSSSSHEH
jgi:zinc/manganese transport system permease protein